MRNTHAVGDRAEAMVLARLLKIYPCVLIPFGNGQRYDLVVDTGTQFMKVQCKSGSIRKGCIEFNTQSLGKSYRGEVDTFGVYCAGNDKIYLIPVGDVGERKGYLRLDPVKNNQTAKVRWAKSYELA